MTIEIDPWDLDVQNLLPAETVQKPRGYYVVERQNVFLDEKWHPGNCTYSTLREARKGLRLERKFTQARLRIVRVDFELKVHRRKIEIG